MASKKNKIIKHLHKCIEHDFGFYNPEWKWNSLPKNIKDNYDLIEDTLLEWKQKEYIDIYEKEGIKYIKIFNVPKL